MQLLGTTGTYLSQFGAYGTGNSQFRTPGGICRDPRGRQQLLGCRLLQQSPAEVRGGRGAHLRLRQRLADERGANAYGYIDVPASTWWALAPGDNSVQVTGGSTWTASWRDAWL